MITADTYTNGLPLAWRADELGNLRRLAVLDLHLPLLGDVHLVTSTLFDIGVYLIVVGLVLDVLRSLGAEVDRHQVRRPASRAIGGAGVRPSLMLLVAAGVTLLLERTLTRVVLGLILLGNGANLLILLAATPGGPPIVGTTEPGRMTDSLPQAMILTAIVITLGMTAFLLALAYRSCDWSAMTRCRTMSRTAGSWSWPCCDFPDLLARMHAATKPQWGCCSS